ncbi:Niemann-Pick C1 protein-like protein [Leptotrombidium deliense]|uniref:Niemann-Pick C1 protein-like protein n=1 Tax=Leptotrombidium deliense TaxID=299467 RepID=A0A443S9D6_9ACAR|nr:Niemann-Pick C1 protein-like protein [Leptotrombidium deliense]
MNFFKIVFLVLLSLIKVSNQQCLMKGVCEKKSFGIVPCEFNGPPEPLLDNDAKEVMNEICPHLASEDALCCDKDQIFEMKRSFEISGLFLKICPSCFLNYGKVFCHLYCSAKQNTFLKVLNTTKGEDGKNQVDEVTYFVNVGFANDVYYSCQSVTRHGLKIIDVFCKPWSAEKCNYQRMLNYMGADETHFGRHPFQVDFIFVNTMTINEENETFTANVRM